MCGQQLYNGFQRFQGFHVGVDVKLLVYSCTHQVRMGLSSSKRKGINEVRSRTLTTTTTTGSEPSLSLSLGARESLTQRYITKCAALQRTLQVEASDFFKAVGDSCLSLVVEFVVWDVTRLEVGMRIDCLNASSQWVRAIIVDIDDNDPCLPSQQRQQQHQMHQLHQLHRPHRLRRRLRIHYEGRDSAMDEWIPLNDDDDDKDCTWGAETRITEPWTHMSTARHFEPNDAVMLYSPLVPNDPRSNDDNVLLPRMVACVVQVDHAYGNTLLTLWPATILQVNHLGSDKLLTLCPAPLPSTLPSTLVTVDKNTFSTTTFPCLFTIAFPNSMYSPNQLCPYLDQVRDHLGNGPFYCNLGGRLKKLPRA